jgi:hypothetical protein
VSTSKYVSLVNATYHRTLKYTWRFPQSNRRSNRIDLRALHAHVKSVFSTRDSFLTIDRLTQNNQMMPRGDIPILMTRSLFEFIFPRFFHLLPCC